MSVELEARGPAFGWKALYPLLLTAGLSAAAGLTFNRTVELAALMAPVLLAAFLPVAVHIVASLASPGIRTLPILALQTAVLVVAGWAIAVTTGASGEPRGIVDVVGGGLTDTWRSLLISTLPAVPTPKVVFLVVTLVWWASTLSGAALPLRRGRLASLIPPLIVLVLAIAYGISGSGTQTPQLMAFAALSVLLAGTLRQTGDRVAAATGPEGFPAVRRRRTGLGRAAALTVVAAIVAGLSIVLGPRLPGIQARPPYDPRTLVQAPRLEADQINPITQAAAWWANDPQPLFTVRGDLSANLRLVVLGGYDGQQWISNASYVLAGTRIPPSSETPTAAHTTVEISVGALPGPWLPAPDRPVAVDGTRVQVDPESATLVAASGHAAGSAYIVESAVPSYDLPAVLSAVQASSPEAEAFRALPPGLPDSISATARTAIAGATFPYQEMVLLQDWMSDTFRYAPDALSGQSYGRIETFLSERRGTAEQFATAFALMARSLGFPSRVAVGFLTGTAVTDGSTTVSTTDAIVWPEVEFTGLGWVPFSPTPREESADTPNLGSPTIGEPDDRAKLDSAIADQDLEPAETGPPSSRLESGWSTGEALIIAALAAIFLAMMWPLVLIVRRMERRRRGKKLGEARERLVAAWQDALGSLTWLVSSDLSTSSGTEVVKRGVDTLDAHGCNSLEALSRQATWAIFSGADVNADEAEQAWARADDIRRGVRSSMGWRSRFRLAYGLTLRRDRDANATAPTVEPASPREGESARGESFHPDDDFASAGRR